MGLYNLILYIATRYYCRAKHRGFELANQDESMRKYSFEDKHNQVNPNKLTSNEHIGYILYCLYAGHQIPRAVFLTRVWNTPYIII